MREFRDAALVARFELKRAIRTWRALALVFLYLVAATGAAFLFSQLIWLFEEQLALSLGTALPSRPGGLLGVLVDEPALKIMLTRLTGGVVPVDDLLRYPPLAIFHLWFGMVLAPFFAAAASAESIAIDARSRALRFEALRTGRLELVMGRFAGQVLLVGVATFVSVLGTWAIGTFYMLGHEPLDLLIDLCWLSLRAWAVAVPFVGIGVACSQLTTSPAWARVLAVGVTVLTWVITFVARYYRMEGGSLLWESVLALMPQGWMRAMWFMDGGWVLASAICVTMGVAAVGAGWLRFRGRDL